MINDHELSTFVNPGIPPIFHSIPGFEEVVVLGLRIPILGKFVSKGYRPLCTGNPFEMDLAENLHTYVF
jgi:hypothetical protein